MCRCVYVGVCVCVYACMRACVCVCVHMYPRWGIRIPLEAPNGMESRIPPEAEIVGRSQLRRSRHTGMNTATIRFFTLPLRKIP